MDLEHALGASWLSAEIMENFYAICDFGGRLAGTESEFAAREYLSEQLDKIGGTRADFTFDYTGRLPDAANVRLGGRSLGAIALPGSPPLAQTELEVIDLGTGTERDFEAAGSSIAGKAVLVRHEYPFTTGHTHRRYKYEWAKRGRAAAFLIMNNNPMGGPVAGGSGSGEAEDIPAAGLSWEAGELLRTSAASGPCRIQLEVTSHEHTWPARNLILEIPGQTDEWVLLCAHADGHAPAESAMDNGTGLAAVLETGRRLAPLVPSLRRGLRLAFFTVEEWGLDGSARYVDQMSQRDRDKIALTIALDSITGHPRLSALTGCDSRLDAFVADSSRAHGLPVDVIRPKLSNSDHYNFQAAGMRAMRLIAGYGKEEALTRFLLTPADTRALVEPSQLKAATLSVIALTYAACSQDLA